MKVTHMIAMILLVIGGLNWGLIGVGHFIGKNWDVVTMIFGAWPTFLNIIFILVGISAILSLCCHKKDCKMCDSKAAPGGQQM